MSRHVFIDKVSIANAASRCLLTHPSPTGARVGKGLAQFLPKTLGREIIRPACLILAIVIKRFVIGLIVFAVTVAERGGSSFAVRVVAGDVKHLVRVPRISIVRGLFA